MNYSQLNVLVLYLALVVFFMHPLHAEELDGIDLFIQACQHQGLNPVMIRTGYAEMEVEITDPPYQSVSDPNPPKTELQTQRRRRNECHWIPFISGNYSIFSVCALVFSLEDIYLADVSLLSVSESFRSTAKNPVVAFLSCAFALSYLLRRR